MASSDMAEMHSFVFLPFIHNLRWSWQVLSPNELQDLMIHLKWQGETSEMKIYSEKKLSFTFELWVGPYLLYWVTGSIINFVQENWVSFIEEIWA